MNCITLGYTIGIINFVFFLVTYGLRFSYYGALVKAVNIFEHTIQLFSTMVGGLGVILNQG